MGGHPRSGDSVRHQKLYVRATAQSKSPRASRGTRKPRTKSNTKQTFHYPKINNRQQTTAPSGRSYVDLYHWSSAKFSSTWYDTLSVLVAKGRAKVSVAASEADWSKRIREMQYADYEDHTVGS